MPEARNAVTDVYFSAIVTVTIFVTNWKNIYRRIKKVNKSIVKEAVELSKTRKLLLSKDFNQPPSKVRRIPIEVDHTLKTIGNGNFNKGIYRAACIVKSLESNGTVLDEIKINALMKPINDFMDLLEDFYPDIHRNDLHNLPTFIRVALSTKKCNFSILESKAPRSKKDGE